MLDYRGADRQTPLCRNTRLHCCSCSCYLSNKLSSSMERTKHIHTHTHGTCRDIAASSSTDLLSYFLRNSVCLSSSLYTLPHKSQNTCIADFRAGVNGLLSSARHQLSSIYTIVAVSHPSTNIPLCCFFGTVPLLGSSRFPLVSHSSIYLFSSSTIPTPIASSSSVSIRTYTPLFASHSSPPAL